MQELLATILSIAILTGTSYAAKIYNLKKSNNFEDTPEPHRTTIRRMCYLPTPVGEAYALWKIGQY